MPRIGPVAAPKPSKPAKAESWKPSADWKVSINIIVRAGDGESKRYAGKILGTLAVHDANKDDPSATGYTVTHTLSGFKLVTVGTVEDAQRIAEDALKDFAPLFDEDDVEVIRAAAPKRMTYWLADCNKSGKHEELIPF